MKTGREWKAEHVIDSVDAFAVDRASSRRTWIVPLETEVALDRLDVKVPAKFAPDVEIEIRVAGRRVARGPAFLFARDFGDGKMESSILCSRMDLIEIEGPIGTALILRGSTPE